MKKLLTIPFVFISYIICIGQGVAINQSNIPADASAMLDIESTTKGVLVPRMNTAHRIGIIAPATGLLVYDTDTRDFWFYDGGWKEIAGGGVVTGPASGDLTGNYPSPTVAKIQNLDVVFGVPFDHQVLKWDALANNWKGRNDSLFLPYNVAFGSATKLFGIQNNNITSGASAICGKSGNAGSGITPSGTMGVWGDNSNGLGVVGTSNTGIGTYGLSLGNHGVYGYSVLQGFAGVKGSHANAGGIGVMGEVQNSGVGVLGQSSAVSGKAGIFTSTNSGNTDTTFMTTTQGQGILSFFNIANNTNNKPVIEIKHDGFGIGLKLRQTSISNGNNTVDAVTEGTGTAIYGKSKSGVSGKFEITNSSNNYPALLVGSAGMGSSVYINQTNATQGAHSIDIFHTSLLPAINVFSMKGKAAYLSINDTTSTNDVVKMENYGKGGGMEFRSLNAHATENLMELYGQGTGEGLRVSLVNQNNTHAAAYFLNDGDKGIEISVGGTKGLVSTTYSDNSVSVHGKTGNNADAAVAIKGETGAAAQGGIGVYGICPNGDNQGIGVKGVNYSPNVTYGAVTGINNSTGVGVYGEVTAAAGYAVSGICGQSNLDAHAAKFENKFSNSTFENVSILTNGKGINLYMSNTSTTSTQPQLRMVHAGTGNFMQFEASPGDIKTSLAKSGNFKTSGTVTVKNDKGIVRSSTTSQLRVEVVPAHFDPSGSFEMIIPLGFRDVPVTFSTAFTSAPAVYVANLLSDSNAEAMVATVINVTNTGCTLHFVNPHSQDIAVWDTTWNLVAMGQE